MNRETGTYDGDDEMGLSPLRVVNAFRRVKFNIFYFATAVRERSPQVDGITKEIGRDIDANRLTTETTDTIPKFNNHKQLPIDS